MFETNFSGTQENLGAQTIFEGGRCHRMLPVATGLLVTRHWLRADFLTSVDVYLFQKSVRKSRRWSIWNAATQMNWKTWKRVTGWSASAQSSTSQKCLLTSRLVQNFASKRSRTFDIEETFQGKNLADHILQYISPLQRQRNSSWRHRANQPAKSINHHLHPHGHFVSEPEATVAQAEIKTITVILQSPLNGPRDERHARILRLWWTWSFCRVRLEHLQTAIIS